MQGHRQEATLNIGLLNAGVRSRDNAGVQGKGQEDGRGSTDIGSTSVRQLHVLLPMMFAVLATGRPSRWDRHVLR